MHVFIISWYLIEGTKLILIIYFEEKLTIFRDHLYFVTIGHCHLLTCCFLTFILLIISQLFINMLSIRKEVSKTEVPHSYQSHFTLTTFHFFLFLIRFIATLQCDVLWHFFRHVWSWFWPCITWLNWNFCRINLDDFCNAYWEILVFLCLDDLKIEDTSSLMIDGSFHESKIIVLGAVTLFAFFFYQGRAAVEIWIDEYIVLWMRNWFIYFFRMRCF